MTNRFYFQDTTFALAIIAMLSIFASINASAGVGIQPLRDVLQNLGDCKAQYIEITESEELIFNEVQSAYGFTCVEPTETPAPIIQPGLVRAINVGGPAGDWYGIEWDEDPNGFDPYLDLLDTGRHYIQDATDSRPVPAPGMYRVVIRTVSAFNWPSADCDSDGYRLTVEGQQVEYSANAWHTYDFNVQVDDRDIDIVFEWNMCDLVVYGFEIWRL